MRKLIVFVALALGVLSGSAALADHFDNNPGTGTFNPQLTGSISQTLVNRTTNFQLRMTQADHEDPPVVSRLRTPGDWQFAYAGTRQAEAPGGVPTTRCSDTIDGRRDSPEGTGTGTNLDFSKRTNARFARAEKIGRALLRVHADGISRPGAPIEWTGDIAFISYDALNQRATLCALFITTDTRVTQIPDPPGGGDDIEGVTEIEGEFPVQRVTDGTGTYWETLIDLTDLIQDDTLQSLHVSVLELKSDFNGMSAGNWNPGAVAFSKAPAVSGPKAFQGLFKTCPANDPAYGNCKSGRPDVTRTIPVTITLPAPAIASAGGSFNTNPLAVSGSSDPGASVQVYDGGVAAGSPATADGSGLWTASVPLTDGPHTLTARTVDAGGQSGLSNAINVSIDTTAPVPPIINTPVEGHDNNGTSVTYSGTAEPLSTVEVVDGGVLSIGTTVAQANGTWSFTAISPKGGRSIAARATDTLGNVGEFGPTREFLVRTATPIIVTPVQNGATNNPSVVVSGTSEPSAMILIYGPSGLLDSTGSDANGSWSKSISLLEGSYTITAQAWKDASFSNLSPVRSFDVDLTAPLAGAISSPTEGQEVRSISVPVSGTGEALASAAIYEGAARVGSASINAAGEWNAIVALADGEHTLAMQVIDRAGNVSPISQAVTFIVNDPLEITSPMSGSIHPGSITIAGSADPASSQVRVYEGFAEIGRASVANGRWSFPKTLPSGQHTLRARAVTAGVLGPFSDPVTFTTDATKPNVKIKKPSGYLLFGRLIGDPLQGYADDKGPADSKVARVEVTYADFLTGDEVTKVVACASCPAASITWSDMPDLAPGIYDVTATAYDVVGNSASETITFVIV